MAKILHENSNSGGFINIIVFPDISELFSYVEAQDVGDGVYEAFDASGSRLSLTLRGPSVSAEPIRGKSRECSRVRARRTIAREDYDLASLGRAGLYITFVQIVYPDLGQGSCYAIAHALNDIRKRDAVESAASYITSEGGIDSMYRNRRSRRSRPKGRK